MSRARRSAHFVPGANEKMLQKSLGLAADALILDLEDAVTPENKGSARRTVADWLRDVDFGRQERIVRVNSLDSPWWRDDLEGVLEHPPDALLVPKVNDGDDVRKITRLLDGLEEAYGHERGTVELILLATETARGVLNVGTMVTSDRVTALTWGAEDLSADLGSRTNRDSEGRLLPLFEYCRHMTLLSATAAGIPAIDSVFVDIRDAEGLALECSEAADMGFVGKISIHPAQIDIINDAFTPSDEDVETARELLAELDKHQSEGRMAFAFRGQMVDVPHFERARKLLALRDAIDGN